MGDHRGSWRWQSSSSLTIKPQAAVSDLPTMQHIFKRAQFWPVKNRQLRADVFQESGKTRAYLGRRVWRRAALTAHQPAEHTHYINCFWLSLSLSPSSSFLLSFVVVALSYLSISLSPRLVNPDLWRGLCFSSIISSHEHTQDTPELKEEAFHSYERNICWPCSCEPHQHTLLHHRWTAHCRHYTGGQKRVKEGEERRRWMRRDEL